MERIKQNKEQEPRALVEEIFGRALDENLHDQDVLRFTKFESAVKRGKLSPEIGRRNPRDGIVSMFVGQVEARKKYFKDKEELVNSIKTGMLNAVRRISKTLPKVIE